MGQNRPNDSYLQKYYNRYIKKYHDKKKKRSQKT